MLIFVHHTQSTHRRYLLIIFVYILVEEFSSESTCYRRHIQREVEVLRQIPPFVV